MKAEVIKRVNELGSSKPELLTWTNHHGENIGDGPSWNTMETSNDKASDSSADAGAMANDDDNNIMVAEEDREVPTTDVDAVDNIEGVDDRRMDTQDVYEVWNEEVPAYDVDRINDDVEVTDKLALGGVTTKAWDQPMKVISEVTAETKVPSTGTAG